MQSIMKHPLWILIITSYLQLNSTMEEETINFREAIISVVLKNGWKNIMIINGLENVTDSLVSSLFNVGLSTTVINADRVQQYGHFPSRKKLIRDFNGYLLVTKTEKSLEIITRQLKKRRVINARRKWFLAALFTTGKPNLELKEGDNVLFLRKKLAEYEENKLLCPNQINETGGIEEIYTLYSLYSTGGGDIFFCKIGYWNQKLHLFHDNSIYYPHFKNFRNRTLNITSLGRYPVREEPTGNDPRWKGCMFEAVNILADHYNFSYIVYDPPDKMYALPINGSKADWKGLIGELTTQRADMAVADLSWSPDRAAAVDFTHKLFDETLTFIYRAPNFLTRAWILFEPYSKQMWMALGLTAILISLTLFFITCLDVCLLQNTKVEVLNLLYWAIEATFRIMVTQGSDTLPIMITGRIIVGTWLLSMVIFVAIYSGNLTYSLSFHKTDKPVDNLKEMVSKYSSAKLAVRYGSLPHSYFMEDNWIYKDVWKNNMEQNVVPGDILDQEIMNLVRNSSYVWISERTILQYEMIEASVNHTFCEFYVSKANILHTDWAIALQKDSPFLQQFNKKIKWMRYSGLVKKWKKHYWTKKRQGCVSTDGINRQELVPVTLDDTEAVFFLLAGGFLLSFVVFLSEIIVFRISKFQSLPLEKLNTIKRQLTKQ
ncbi:glutamate receptor ionotropic, delta-2-like isoform X2 [Centruroides sculpturatus]|uniref:glutamate receptor ionotropic, delta-2-like isoform X2 n=1 Tax=Centruroides sculpturatus TaxID=218467 RepID=UPI000C6EC7F6|nr:glutamate receptor ionotropic, delta-2-like isoform X2 [Centruroides sculpturatus]